MTVESCKEFLRTVQTSRELGQQMKAMTGIDELVLLGRRNGYTFGTQEVVAACASYDADVTIPRTPAASSTPADPSEAATVFCHYEYKLADLPGFGPVGAELPHLKIKPPTLDHDRFAAEFCAEELRSTSLSPADPEFRAWNQKRERAQVRDTAVKNPSKNGFHLIDLDEHVTHEGYPAYLAAKHRIVATLERVFGDEVRFSGSMWYPPSSYRLWHTNRDQPGWRMYIVDTDKPFDDPAKTSFFRYMNPHTRAIVTLSESPGIVRFFKVEQDPRKLFWHCIVNPTDRHRWSFGFVVPDTWMDRLQPADGTSR